MAATKYTYNVANDFPGGEVNIGTLQTEIQSSSIVTALDYINSAGGGSIDIWFKAALSTGDKTVLDGDVTGPAGGLIATHDNSDTAEEPQNVKVTNAPDVHVSGIHPVILTKPSQADAGRIYVFSCDFTKKETFYVGSSGAFDTFAADGVQSVFDLPHGSGNGSAIIDLSHNKITEENLIVTSSGTSYVPIVKINGAVQEEREAYESTGGHYEIDYVAGQLKFFAAPPSGNTVSMEYFVSGADHGPYVLAGPAAGKKWTLNAAEVQFSSDIEMTDTMIQNVIVDVPIFDASGNYVTTLIDYKAAPDAVYANVGNFLDYTYGSYPIVPACGGSTRGLTKDTLILRWDYLSTIELSSQINARIKVWTKHGRAFNGERVVVTIYGTESDE